MIALGSGRTMTKTGRHPQWSLPPFDSTRKCSGLKPGKALANQDKLVTQIYWFRAKQTHIGGEHSNPTPICSKQCENQTWKQPGSYLNLTSADFFLDNEQESHFLWIECAYWGDTSVGTAWRFSTVKPIAIGILLLLTQSQRLAFTWLVNHGQHANDL